MSEKTVFISYRRDAAGKAFAQLLAQDLKHRGYDAFLDVNDMDSGQWATQILTEVPKRAHFLLLLTPGALDCCQDENDWVRREFLTAVQHGRNIAPIREESVDLAELRKTAPGSMQAVFGLQTVDIRHGSFEADVERLIARYIPPHKAPKEPKTDSVLKTESVSPFEQDLSRIESHAPEHLLGREAELALLDQAWNQGRPGFATPAATFEGQADAQNGSDGLANPATLAQHPRILTFVAMGGEGKTSLVAHWASRLVSDPAKGCETAFAWSFYSQGAKEQSNASADLFLHDALVFFGDADMANSPRPAAEKGKRLAALVAERRTLLVLDGLEPLQYPPTAKGLEKGKLKDPGLAALLRGLAQRNPCLCLVTTRLSVADLKNQRQTAPEIELKRLSNTAGVELLGKLGVNGSVKERGQLVEDVYGHALTLNLLGSYLREAHAGDIRRRDRVKLAEADAEEQNGHAFHVMDAYVRWFEQTPLSLDGRGAGGEGKKGRSGFATPTGTFEDRNPAQNGSDGVANPVTLQALPPLSLDGRGAGGEGDKGPRALALLRLLGLFDRPASADCLAALLQAPAIPGLTEPLVGLGEAPLNLVLTRLAETHLLTVNRDGAGGPLSLDAHPLLREYFATKLQTEAPQAWRSAHERLFRHLCKTTQDKAEPTLDDLQPLYQAVAHGCAAGLQQEACDKVYFARIHRRNQGYSVKKLGAFGVDLGAIASFFEELWSRVSPALTKADQAWLMSQTAFLLLGLGRLVEALEPMRFGLAMGVKQENWREAAIRASNLSELKLTLGEVANAVTDAEQSVAYADRSDDSAWKMTSLTTLADAEHQVGQREAAAMRFQEAEAMQAENWPDYPPLLYSLAGFRYCDLLLAASERAAGRAMILAPVSKQADRGKGHGLDWIAKLALHIKAGNRAKQAQHSGCSEKDLLATCHAVSQRAGLTLKSAEQWKLSLLTIALDHLTLARAALYATSLDESAELPPGRARAETLAAVDGLRRAGDMHHIPRGLLTRAWLRRLEGVLTGPDSAQEDLDEAYEIAERGPMPLFLADIHLHRARLFGTLDPALCSYPWQSPAADLREARRLIEQHGYWRRKEELEDAEAVFRQ